MIVADLHVHSLVSDGRLTPAEVIGEAARCGVSVLVLTDHGHVTWDGDLLAIARRAGVELPFPGVEISTEHHGRRHHILAYGEGILDEGFQAYVAAPTEHKNRRYRAIVDELRRRGVPLPDFTEILHGVVEGVARHPYKHMGSRTLIAQYVAATVRVDQVTARDMVVAADAALDEDAPPAYLPTGDVIDRVRSVGGLAALAHPLWQADDDDDVTTLLSDLAEFRRAGVQALETGSYHHRLVADEARLHDALAGSDLVRTQGSDFHGNGRSAIGSRGVDALELARLRDAVAGRRAA